MAHMARHRPTLPYRAEAIYHLYLGWYERNQFKRSTSAELAKQLRVVGVLAGAELAPAEGDRA
jgi:alkyl sulfatase BDS1-like metallo-beta-lactamase superfamily hydrolase